MVSDEVWERAWRGCPRKWWWRHVSGQQILCVACLERRLGRRLTRCDFADAPVNDLGNGDYRSDRLIDRLTAGEMTKQTTNKRGDDDA
jgi:hypothetical protein